MASYYFDLRVTDCPNDFQQKVVKADDGTILYIAHGRRGLATNQDGWIIHKYTVNGNVETRQTAYDAFDNYLTATYA